MFLEIRDIKKSFGTGDSKVDVLKGLDLDIEKGEFCVLLGPSGSGKSTLLNIIGGIESADGGSISIEGEKLADMKEKKLSQYRRKHLGYIFQMYNLISNLTVRENIEVGAYLSDRALDVDELLHTLGLFEHQRKLPNQLSGGQQQRTAIGRAIVKNPDILQELCNRKANSEHKPIIVGFCAESENLIDNAKAKIKKKGCDFLAANDISKKDIGFSSDENEIQLLEDNGTIYSLTKDLKTTIARKMLSIIAVVRNL